MSVEPYQGGLPSHRFAWTLNGAEPRPILARRINTDTVLLQQAITT